MGKAVTAGVVDVAGILASGQAIRLVREGGQWTVMRQQPSGWVLLGTLPKQATETLLQSGKLVQQDDVTLVPRQSHGINRRDIAAAMGRGKSAILVNDRESPLSWLSTRKDKSGQPLITAQQFMAGERLRADFERSMLAQRVTSNWDPAAAARRSGGPVQAELSDGALAARQRFHKAMDAAGPELSSILYEVCCLASGLEQAERALGLPQRSGKAVLGLALNALVRHYGLAGHGDASKRTGRHWGSEDYRPAIPEYEDA